MISSLLLLASPKILDLISLMLKFKIFTIKLIFFIGELEVNNLADVIALVETVLDYFYELLNIFLIFFFFVAKDIVFLR